MEQFVLPVFLLLLFSLTRYLQASVKQMSQGNDATKFLAGFPDRHVMIALQKGNSWYIGNHFREQR